MKRLVVKIWHENKEGDVERVHFICSGEVCSDGIVIVILVSGSWIREERKGR